MTNGEVNGSDADEPTFDGLVVAAGVGSRRIGVMLGDRMNAYLVKGYSINATVIDRTGARFVAVGSRICIALEYALPS